MKPLALIATLLVAGALAATAQARPAGACTPPVNVLYWARGFAIQLKDSTRPGHVGPHAHAPAIQVPLCGPSDANAAAMTALAHQRRYYVLLAAFPARPTAAQWKARWKPLLAEAAATDAALLDLVRAITKVDPYGGGMGDPAYIRSRLNADRSWLLRHEATPFGAPVS